MRRLLAITILLLTVSSFAYAQKTTEEGKPTREYSYWRTGLKPDSSSEDLRQIIENFRYYVPGSADLFRIGDTFFGAPVWMKWPDKRVSLDVKDADISEIAKTLQEQTGVEFIVGEGVPSDLKITIHVSNMRTREFLDTLTSTTGMIYVPESRVDESTKQPEPKAGEAPAKDTNTSIPSHEQRFPSPIKPQMVTHVTILNPRSEGIVVNMGKVSVSLKNADPIDAVTNLVKQIKGASYVVMSLDDYLALQSPSDSAQIKKALKKAGRRKITLELRSVEVADALTQISASGQFYMTIPKPGLPNFLIVPDVTVADESALPSPPISYWSSPCRESREQDVCVQYTREMLASILQYAKENGGVLPDAAKWVELIPVRNEYLERRMPGGRYQYSYGMNVNLSGVKLSSIKKPAQTVLIFESDVNRGYGTENDVIRNLRHPGGVVYGFADGSVKILLEKPNFKP